MIINRLLLPLTILVATTTPLRGQDSAAVLPHTWIVGPTEGAGFCLILDENQRARIVGAFPRLGSLRWSFDSTKGELSLSMPRADSLTRRHFQRSAGRSFISFDTLANTAVYNVVLGETIWFDGYTLFPRAALDSSEYFGVPRPCKTSPP